MGKAVKGGLQFNNPDPLIRIKAKVMPIGHKRACLIHFPETLCMRSIRFLSNKT